MKGARIVIFVYDITRRETFEQLNFWISNTKEVLGEKPILGIVGNKSDLYFNEEIKEEEAEEFAQKNNIPFQLTSAKTPKSFSDFLEKLVVKYIEKLDYERENSVVNAVKLDDNEDPLKSNKKGNGKKGCC